MDQGLTDRVLLFLRSHFAAEIPQADTPLAGRVLRDSLATMEVVVFLEQEFDLVVKRTDLERLGTAESIADLIRERRG